MSKVQLAVALSILATFAVPVAAQAAPAHSLSSTVVFTEHHGEDEDEDEDFEDSEDEDEDSYEDEDGENSFGGVVDDNDGDLDVPMPSIVIDPNGLGHPHGGPEGEYDITRVGPDLGGPLGTVDPRGNAPIRVDKVQPNRKTPADIFAEGSIIGLGALGAGAIALGAVAGVRSIRLRRSEKADYFYES